MECNFLKNKIIIIISIFYILISAMLFFITRNMNNYQVEYVNNILDMYFWGSIGIYSGMEPFYSKLVVNILATLTPILAILLLPFRKDVDEHRKKDTWSNYIITLCIIPFLYWFLWGDSWKLVSDDRFSLLREMINFNLIVCPLYSAFISEIWYLIYIIEKLYFKIFKK